MKTIFASGLQTGLEMYMPLKWVLKNGNIPNAILKTEQDLKSAIAYKDRENISVLEKKLVVLKSL